MVTLEAIGREPLQGYVWQNSTGTGWRLAIVVDDWYDLPNWEANGDFPSAHAYGLPTLRDELAIQDSTRAIGFFCLPDPKSTTFEQDVQELIDFIHQWVLEVSDDTCRCYLLVDYFYGEGFNQANNSGIPFVEYWRRKFPEVSQEGFLPTKLAHLSVSGATSSADSNNISVFSKVDIQSNRKLPLSLHRWFDIEEHPLTRLWRLSSGWFAAGKNDDDIMKHTRGNIEQYFLNGDEKARQYRYKIEEALGFQLPDGWWQSPKSVGNIHESLKHLCGVLFCGQTTSEDFSSRHISTGSAFLIALMAHQQECGTLGAMGQDSQIWLNCSKATSPIFARQDRSTAEATTLALYDCFRFMFEVRSRSESGSTQRVSQVTRVVFDDHGRILKIQLAWNAHQKEVDRLKSLSEVMAELFQQESVSIPKSSKNLREAIIRLWSLMVVSENGCLSPGAIYLEGNIFFIASTQ